MSERVYRTGEPIPLEIGDVAEDGDVPRNITSCMFCLCPSNASANAVCDCACHDQAEEE